MPSYDEFPDNLPIISYNLEITPIQDQIQECSKAPFACFLHSMIAKYEVSIQFYLMTVIKGKFKVNDL